MDLLCGLKKSRFHAARPPLSTVHPHEPPRGHVPLPRLTSGPLRGDASTPPVDERSSATQAMNPCAGQPGAPQKTNRQCGHRQRRSVQVPFHERGLQKIDDDIPQDRCRDGNRGSA